MTKNLVEGKDFDTVTPVLDTRVNKNKNLVETVEAETVDYKDLSVDELIKIIEDKDRACENYKTTIEGMEKKHEMSIKNMADSYDNHVKKLTSVIRYYERKLRVLGDIINMEDMEEVKR